MGMALLAEALALRKAVKGAARYRSPLTFISSFGHLTYLPTCTMSRYSSLSEAVEQLQQQGYTEDFRWQGDVLVCRKSALALPPDTFRIDGVYRFDVDSDPADQAVLYAISSEKQGVKGLVINGYGIYSDPAAGEMLRKLSPR